MRISITFLELLIIICICACCKESSSKQKISLCNSNKVHIPYETYYGKYVLFSDQDVPEEHYRLTLSTVSDDTSYTPLLKFVRKAAANNSLNPSVIIFYAVDTNVVQFLENNCTSAKGFMLYERNGTAWTARLFKQNYKELFIEDTLSRLTTSQIAFKLILENLHKVQKSHPQVAAYHSFSSPKQ